MGITIYCNIFFLFKNFSFFLLPSLTNNNIIYTKIYNPENLILLEKNENYKTENNELINSEIGDYTSNLNLFRLNSNNSFYRLNKNLIYDDRVLFKPLNVPKQIVKTKYPKDYSIFKLYED